jgi:hypothetical protein
VRRDDVGPDAVCAECVGSLDFYIRFGAKSRKADEMFRKGEEPEFIMATLNCKCSEFV